jgi:hypothetical protein
MAGECAVAPIEQPPEHWGPRKQIQRVSPPDASHDVAIDVGAGGELAVGPEQADIPEQLSGVETGTHRETRTLQRSNCKAVMT